MRRGGFLRRYDHGQDLTRSLELEYDLELILRLIDVMDLCTRLGASPREVWQQAWQPLYGAQLDARGAADALRRMLGTLYTGADWLVIARQLADRLEGAAHYEAPELPDGEEGDRSPLPRFIPLLRQGQGLPPEEIASLVDEPLFWVAPEERDSIATQADTNPTAGQGD